MQTHNEVGLIKSLFDFNLTSFITMRVIRFLYALLTILTVLFGVAALITGLFGGYGDGGRFLVIILAPLGTLLYLILIRLWVEFLANLYRIGDNTQKMVDALPSE